MMNKKNTYVEVTVQTKPFPIGERLELAPWPEELQLSGEPFPFPPAIVIEGVEAGNPAERRTVETIVAFLDSVGRRTAERGTKPWVIRFKSGRKLTNPEAYQLKVAKEGALIEACGPAGRFYGTQTLLQILAGAWHTGLTLGNRVAVEPDPHGKKWVPTLSITDCPRYRLRSFMVDAGRSIFPLPYLKRIVRIMAHLKLNTLHYHAFDDELCGIRFNKLPLGRENPFAISLADLRELIEYAAGYHITVMPELESWGHAGSIIYHFPELYGAPGMWGGMSFGVGRKTYDLLAKIYDEVVEVLPDEALLHIGLDEALWATLPGESGRGHTPTNMVQRLHDLVQAAARRHKKEVSVHLWADHGGRPLPEKLRHKLAIQPWKYRQNDEPRIIEALQQYGGEGKTPCMMGAGWSSAHFQGSFEATRLWAREGLKYPNILGITNCMWCSNDLAGQMIGLYGGASYSWNPLKPGNTTRDPLWEDNRCAMLRRMRHWQSWHPDADPTGLNQDRLVEVYEGRYAFGPLAGKAVAPTTGWIRAELNKPRYR